jgi:hypothetical protein
MTNPPPGGDANKTCINENCKRTLLALRGGGGQRNENEKPIRWRKSKGEFFSPVKVENSHGKTRVFLFLRGVFGSLF